MLLLACVRRGWRMDAGSSPVSARSWMEPRDSVSSGIIKQWSFLTDGWNDRIITPIQSIRPSFRIPQAQMISDRGRRLQVWTQYKGEKKRRETHPATSLTMDRTNSVRLLRRPFKCDGRGLETRGVVFCSHGWVRTPESQRVVFLNFFPPVSFFFLIDHDPSTNSSIRPSHPEQ